LTRAISALFLAPLFKTLVSMMAHSGDKMPRLEPKLAVTMKPTTAQRLSSIAAQWYTNNSINSVIVICRYSALAKLTGGKTHTGEFNDKSDQINRMINKQQNVTDGKITIFTHNENILLQDSQPNRNTFTRVSESVNEEEDKSNIHYKITSANKMSEFDENKISNKSQRKPRSTQLESTDDDTDYYDTTDEYDRRDEEFNGTSTEFQDNVSEEQTTDILETAESPQLVNTLQPEITSTQPETSVTSTSELPLKPTTLEIVTRTETAKTTSQTLETTTSQTLEITQVAKTTTEKQMETGLIEVEIPDTVNMCVVKCYLSETFLRKYLFVLLFLCYFIPIIASITMYFSATPKPNIIEVKPSTADETCNIQTTIPSKATVKHSILSSVAMWTPTLVETLLRLWFCISTPQWLTTLLFMLAQIHAIIRNSLNVRLVRKQTCTGTIQPLSESEDTPSKLSLRLKQQF
ncbi:hypothetical protein L9F63_024250, partial [Diploptera punctata]